MSPPITNRFNALLIVACVAACAAPRVWAASLTVTTVAGTPGVFGSADGTGGAAQFSSALYVTADASGNLYVSDPGNNNIRKIMPAGVVTTLAGTAGMTGSADGAGPAAQFNNPQQLCVDAAGNVYVADDNNNTIRMITPGGVVTTLAGTAGMTGSADGTGPTAQFNAPLGIAVDAGGNVYVAENGNNTIRKIAPGAIVTTLAGTAGVFGSADGTGPAAQFNRPLGLATDKNGNVYVADASNNAIRKITPAGVVTTLAGMAGAVGSADGTGSTARFNIPNGVATDGAGNVYVTDSINDTIRFITPTGAVTTVAGAVGSSGSTDGMGSAARFATPIGLIVDSAGNVFVADTGNGTIRKGVFPAAPKILALNITDAGGNPAPIAASAAQLNFNASASDPAGLPLTFTWDFGDASAAQSGAFVQHVYNTGGSFTVTLTVSNGSSSATQMASITVLAPNSGGENVPNIAQGQPPVVDPITRLGIAVTSSNGGVIQLGIDTSQLRSAFNVSTDFDTIGGRSSVTETGVAPITKFPTSGIFVAVATATDPVSGALKGKGRKTLLISSAEVGAPAAYTALPGSQKATKLSLNGKFSFSTGGANGKAASQAPLAGLATKDSIIFGATIELPAGVDLSIAQTVFVGVGNIIDSVTLDTRGKAKLPSAAALVQKLQIRFPKLNKGSTQTAAKQTAVVALTLSGPNFSLNGFDTEGITGTLLPSEDPKKPASRSIQIGLEFAGVPYQFSVPVLFKLKTGGASGSVGGRSAVAP